MMYVNIGLRFRQLVCRGTASGFHCSLHDSWNASPTCSIRLRSSHVFHNGGLRCHQVEDICPVCAIRCIASVRRRRANHCGGCKIQITLCESVFAEVVVHRAPVERRFEAVSAVRLYSNQLHRKFTMHSLPQWVSDLYFVHKDTKSKSFKVVYAMNTYTKM